jgi:Bacterial dipeptidyl-peptidase Sh3 domain/NlpC/P60 family
LSDPRHTAARPGVEGTLREVVDAQAPLRRAPSHEAPLDTEALKGERVSVYETNEDGWTSGQLESDKYVGWLPANALAPLGPAPTHKVAALRTLAFPGPSIKLPPIETLPLGARVAVARSQDQFAVTAAGAYLPVRHLVPIGEAVADFVAVAERFVGSPYLWGGKTNLGLDCSGLVQVALTAAGIVCPRDSDMQERAVGKPFNWIDDVSTLQRGDLIFWPGHVAIVRDGVTIVHANAFHMAVAIETTSDAIARIRAAGSEVHSIRRIG